MGNWEWTGFDNVNVPALIISLMIVAALLILGIVWCRSPDTRKRGIMTVSVIVIPVVLSAVVASLRIVAS